jgi:AraC family transcriptional regulator
MVETRRTPARSSGRSFDTSGSFIAPIGPLTPSAYISAPTDANTPGCVDGGPAGTRSNGCKTSLPTSPPPPHQPTRCFTVQEERNWRRPDILASGNRSNLRLVAARWRGSDLSEKTSEITDDYHILSISLNRTKFHFWFGAESISNKEVTPGTLHLTAPGVPTRIVFHKPYDSLHLFIQNALLKEFVEWADDKPPTCAISLPNLEYVHDAPIGNLGVALLSAEELGMHGELFADSLSLAIVSRLFALCAKRPTSTSSRNVAALPHWRLKRVIDFMDSESDKPTTLAELARIAGLSRMHFAAQFRKATGLRPHEYLLRRRIEKAKVMLTTTALPITEVALTVGFSSQSHLTGVFKRLTDVTPLRWRELGRG